MRLRLRLSCVELTRLTSVIVLKRLNIVDAASGFAIQNYYHQEMGQVENNARYFQTNLDELTDAKEQLRMASPAEREMREMLMRIGGDDPDERSKHGAPRQQDLTQQQPPPQSTPQKQQPPPQSSSQSHKQGLRKISRTRTTGETRCTKTTTST